MAAPKLKASPKPLETFRLVLTGSRLEVILLSAVLVTACKSRDESPVAGATPAVTLRACPPEEFMEELHASSFHFQHGSTEVARQHLERARGMTPAPADAVSTKLVAQLSEVSRRVESDPKWAWGETEYVRLAFSDWSCLPRSLHERFHTKLPPLR